MSATAFSMCTSLHLGKGLDSIVAITPNKIFEIRNDRPALTQWFEAMEGFAHSLHISNASQVVINTHSPK